MSPLPDHFHRDLAKKQFAGLANSPHAWGIAAQRLLTSSEILAAAISDAERRDSARRVNHPPEPGYREIVGDELYDHRIQQTVSVWAMLVSLAFENLLKGIVVGKELLTVKANGSSPIEGHDLLRLAKRAQLRMSKEEENFFKDLTQFGVWKGRYTIPKNSEILYSMNKESDSRSTALPLWPMSRAVLTCRVLGERLCAELEITKEQWSRAQEEQQKKK